MTLEERLAELRENILRDRSNQIFNGVSDNLWSDETLLRYIKDAERRFARHTLCLRDATTAEIVQITLVDNTKTYSLHESVLAVISSRYDVDTLDIARSGHGMIGSPNPAEWPDVNAVGGAMATGRPLAYYTDETMVFESQTHVTYSVYPVPGPAEADKIMHLRVIRLPIGAYSLSNLSEESEILEDYQLDCLEWAAYRAMHNHDAEAGDPLKANNHKDMFEAAVKNAMRELKRSMFANTTFRYGPTYVR